MKFFIDTANVDEIAEAAELGILDGVTTNPTLLAREKDKGYFKQILKKICDFVKGPVCAEVVGQDADTMVAEAGKLVKIDDHIVIKVPMTREGLKVMGRLKKDGVKTNATLVFSPNQALLAARAGASFLSPFVGRLDDVSHVGMDLIDQSITPICTDSNTCFKFMKLRSSSFPNFLIDFIHSFMSQQFYFFIHNNYLNKH